MGILYNLLAQNAVLLLCINLLNLLYEISVSAANIFL